MFCRLWDFFVTFSGQVPNLWGCNPTQSVYRLVQDADKLHKSVDIVRIDPLPASLIAILPVIAAELIWPWPLVNTSICLINIIQQADYFKELVYVVSSPVIYVHCKVQSGGYDIVRFTSQRKIHMCCMFYSTCVLSSVASFQCGSYNLYVDFF